MPPNRRTRLALPLLLAALTFALILLALWPNDPPTVAVLVASRDLGAGSVLTAADLTPLSLEAGLAPADAVADPVSLVGQTLAVVRFQGEPVTLRHLGPAVAVQPDERAVSLRVEQDQGLAGILRPGPLETLPLADWHAMLRVNLDGCLLMAQAPPGTCSSTGARSSGVISGERQMSSRWSRPPGP